MRQDIHALSESEITLVSKGLRDPVTYRKSGLSLNHIIGCPLDCAYCIRHKDNNFNMKHPSALMSDDDAVRYLINHKYFQPHITPVQLFNKATDGFLPSVLPHLIKTLELIDSYGFNNHVILITRYRVNKDTCITLNKFRNIRITLFITYSGIDNPHIEPISNAIPAASLRTAYELAERYRVVLYCRPIVPGLNDSDDHLERLFALARYSHAMVITGLFYNKAIKEYFEQSGLPHLYEESARRKIFPAQLESRILSAVRGTAAEGKLFRKTSCGLAFAHETYDYNGHYGIREICDICPNEQQKRCAETFKTPCIDDIRNVAKRIGAEKIAYDIYEHAVETSEIEEEPRYFLQHTLGFQFHDKKYPHYQGRHGRADIGWEDDD